MRYQAQAPHIYHAVAGTILSLVLYLAELGRAGETVNLFLFPNLLLFIVSEAALVSRMWYLGLDIITLATFVETASLLQGHLVKPMVGWEASLKISEQCSI